MLGVVLCGGQSLRMGADKGLIKSVNDNWAQIAVNKLSTLGFPVVVSVNGNQFAEYKDFFPEKLLIRDNNSLQIRGPLLGVLSAHLAYPAEDLFVLACDMPLMEIFILKEIFSDYSGNRNFDTWVFTNNNEPEPLCGIYSSAGLGSVLTMHHDKKLIKHSLKFILENLRSFFKPISNEHKKYFQNINAHSELNGLQGQS